ncbi:MAG TPA: SWIM zinc finger family protein [Bryobacteraceae bacterium]|nr:SWIM zinc finger family protein [Bryobacteraceae bacterium]
MGFYYGWKPYVSAAERRRKAVREVEKRRKQGQTITPVTIEGRKIANTFWGKSWCENLERYSDYANRLPRGRTYVRNGSVVHLEIAPGEIEALVSGSELYKVKLKVAAVGKRRWKSICEDCSGAIDSLVELLQGRFSKGVMERICRQEQGLFPSPHEIDLSCSCPDGVWMCKHIAAVLYGVGARFDSEPELLFRLRAVDEKELIAQAGKAQVGKTGSLVKPAESGKVLGGEDLSEMFGLDMAEANEVVAAPRRPAPPRKAAPKKAAKKSAVRTKRRRV